MRLAMVVFQLDVTQKNIWNLDPKDLIYMRFDCIFFNKTNDFFMSGGVISSIK